MPLITDIPERDGLDGAEQLALLRSYLKDLSTPYQFNDDFLITLLIEKDRITAWRNITGETTDSIPWSYDTTNIQDPINRLRLLIGDTDEAAIQYTDTELFRMLDVIPLRYVVSMLKAKDAGGSTLPADKEDPITLLRVYLEDDILTSPTYTDGQLVDLLISSGNSPYGYIVNRMETSTGIRSASNANSTGGELAAIDGISFSTPSEASLQNEAQKGDVGYAYMNSPYWKEDLSGWFVDGINVTGTDWEVRWYAIR